MALGTDRFWSHKASDYQWRITEGRVAWVVKLNPAATGSNNNVSNLNAEFHCPFQNERTNKQLLR